MPGLRWSATLAGLPVIVDRGGCFGWAGDNVIRARRLGAMERQVTEIKGEPTDRELSDVDDKLMSPGWINLLEGAGLNYRERQVIGWALRMSALMRDKLSVDEEA